MQVCRLRQPRYEARKKQLLQSRLHPGRQIYLTHGGVDDVLGGRQNADPSPASNATSARGLVAVVVPLAV